MMAGLDLSFALKLRNSVDCPITICGGVGSLSDISSLISTVGICGVGVGSFFVFKGKHKAVLLSYDNRI